MTVNKFKNLLKQKGINIHQMEDVANEKLDRLDSFFNVKSKEIFGYALTRNSFRNKLKQKSKNVGDPLNELSNILENINIKDFDQLDRSIKEMESAIEKLKNVVDNIWTDEDKEQLNDLMGAYFQLNIKNKISVRIITVLTKNEYLKLLFQLIIFLLTCFGTKLFSPALQKIYSTLGEQKADFISALIIFLTLERLLKLLENWLVIWRVKNLWISYLSILPLVEYANAIIKKVEKNKLQVKS